MKILWHSNTEWTGTGYGDQTHNFTRALVKAGHEVVINAFHGFSGKPQLNDVGIVTMTAGVERYGNDCIAGDVVAERADIVWSLLDVFALEASTWSKLPWCAWAVIDCTPLRPHEVDQYFTCPWPIAMSHFGEDQLKSAGLDPLYVPHAIDTNLYKPSDKLKARRVMEQVYQRGIGEKFLVMTVAANGTGWPSRKNHVGAFEAFAIFAQTHPDALFYYHSEPLGVWKGDPLLDMAVQYGIADKIWFPDSRWIVKGLISGEVLNQFYNAADVYLLLSHGESFGIPTIEAQSTGLPVIVTDFSASKELCLTGWTVHGPMYSFLPLTRQMIPDVDQAAACLSDAYDIWKAGNMPELRIKTRQAALAYDIERVMKDYMLPTLDVIADEKARGVNRAIAKIDKSAAGKKVVLTNERGGEKNVATSN